MTSPVNIILISIVLIVVILSLYFIFKKDLTLDEEVKLSMNDYKLEYLANGVKDTITAIQNTNISELHLNKSEAKKREEIKAKLDKAKRHCNTGDIGQKEYLKEYQAEILQNKYNINESTIDYVLPFDYENELKVMDKFLILLYIYRKKYKDRGFAELVKEHALDKPKSNEFKGLYYSINEEDVNKAYSISKRKLSFVEKMDIITQLIYQSTEGHGVIDYLREEKSLDDICGGVSGIESTSYEYMDELFLNSSIHSRYDSIWIVFSGKQIRMEFMSFTSNRELQRVVHNLYRNNNSGWMSSQRGYVISDSKDGDRITCARPPFAESFAFWVRKFSSSNPNKLENLIVQEGKELPIAIIRSLVKGCMTIVFTGETDSGKTTLLKAAVGEINDTFPIRTIEIFLEMWLSRLYPHKQITAFRTTDSITTSQAIAFMKKTNAKVMIAGESADFETAAKVVELSLVGSKHTMSTCHPMTTEGLIEYHTSAVMSKGIELYSDDRRAEASVARALNFDIHMVKSKTGERYIERITEIIPVETDITEWPNEINDIFKLYAMLNTRRRTYTTRDIIVFENNRYVLKNPISEYSLKRMYSNMSDKEIEMYESFITKAMEGTDD